MQRGVEMTLLEALDTHVEDCCIGLGALGAVVLGLDVRIVETKFTVVTGVVEILAGWSVTEERAEVERDVILDTCAGPEIKMNFFPR